jgi:hypothetical protein
VEVVSTSTTALSSANLARVGVQSVVAFQAAAAPFARQAGFSVPQNWSVFAHQAIIYTTQAAKQPVRPLSTQMLSARIV